MEFNHDEGISHADSRCSFVFSQKPIKMTMSYPGSTRVSQLSDISNEATSGEPRLIRMENSYAVALRKMIGVNDASTNN